MKFKIVDESNIEKASGLAVVIDVLRAFTTACFIFSKGAREIILVETPDEGLILKGQNQDYILVGERKGIKIPGFDFGNSPYEIKAADFSGKIVVMTTSQGTGFFYRLGNLPNVKERITGSFVNASAIVSYIKRKKHKDVTFVCTDNSTTDNEDYVCAKYLISCLEGNPINFQDIKDTLKSHPLADRFIRRPLTPHAPQDFELSLQLDNFNNVLKAADSARYVVLRSQELC